MSLPLYKKMILEGAIGGAPDSYNRDDLRAMVGLLWAERYRAICVDCHEAHEFLSKHDLKMLSCIKSCPPPFGVYWVEWTCRETDRMIYEGALVHCEESTLRSIGCDDDKRVMMVTAMHVTGEQDLPQAGCGDELCAAVLDSQTGELLNRNGQAGADWAPHASDALTEYLSEMHSDIAMEVYGSTYRWFIRGVLLLNWFMQVRNVTYETIPVKPREAKILRAKAGGQARLDFRTLKISREITRSAKPREPGEYRELPLHLVMGHFKCYDEKPLFGRITGTFFWHAHTRGDKANGQIVKDYVAGKV